MPEPHDIAGTSAFAMLLQQYMSERGLTPGHLIVRSGLSRSTVYRWLEGGSVRPYHRAGLLKLAAALNLPRLEADRLLRAAGFPTLAALARANDPDERASLAYWSSLIRNNLPADLTSFVGREGESSHIAALLCRDSVRLMTLTGAGGTGKTRLAVHVARAVLDVFPDGVFFVSLAAVLNPRMVLPAIAETIGLRDVQDAALPARLEGWLRPRRVLLLLDNLEQLVESGPDITGLLRAAPQLKVLTTSRTPLHVMGEFTCAVHPLPVPRAELLDEKLRQNPAIDLFIQRASAANPGGEIADDEIATIGEICIRLDGLPLAIELAAAQMRERTPARLLTDFPSRLDLSSAGPRGVPTRQQALRNTIAWSLDLLPAAVQSFLIRLTVFVGGWTEQAAQGICCHPDTPNMTVAPMLQKLVDANLIEQVTSSSGRMRYRMLETIRAYGLEQRPHVGDEDLLQERHARHFLDLVEDQPPYVPETRLSDGYARIDEDLDNIRASLIWFKDRDDGERLARLVAALWPYWYEYQRIAEGRQWLEFVLSRDWPISPRMRAQILTGACTLAFTQTAYQDASTYAQEALELWRGLENPRGQALVLRQLAWADYMMGTGAQSIDWLGVALEQWRLVGDPQGIACALSDLGLAHTVLGHFAAALPYLTEADDHHMQAQDELGLARSWRDRGLHALLRGDVDSAIPLLREAVDRLRPRGATAVLSGAVMYLGTALCFAGQLDDARMAYAESLRIHEQIEDKADLALTLLGLGAVAHRRGDGVRAAVLCGAAHAMRQDHHAALPTAVETIYQRETALMRAQTGTARFDEAFADGVVMSTADAITFARSGISDG